MPTILRHNSIQTLTAEAREIIAQVGIHRPRTKNQQVVITQSAEIGVSFEFTKDEQPRHEFHVPIRMVEEIFVQ